MSDQAINDTEMLAKLRKLAIKSELQRALEQIAVGDANRHSLRLLTQKAIDGENLESLDASFLELLR